MNSSDARFSRSGAATIAQSRIEVAGCVCVERVGRSMSWFQGDRLAQMRLHHMYANAGIDYRPRVGTTNGMSAMGTSVPCPPQDTAVLCRYRVNDVSRAMDPFPRNWRRVLADTG